MVAKKYLNFIYFARDSAYFSWFHVRARGSREFLNFECFNGADFLNLDVLAKRIFKFERFAKRIKFMRCLRGGF